MSVSYKPIFATKAVVPLSNMKSPFVSLAVLLAPISLVSGHGWVPVDWVGVDGRKEDGNVPMGGTGAYYRFHGFMNLYSLTGEQSRALFAQSCTTVLRTLLQEIWPADPRLETQRSLRM